MHNEIRRSLGLDTSSSGTNERRLGIGSFGRFDPPIAILVLGGASWCLYATLAWLSGFCDYDVPGVERPLLAVLGLLTLAFACYLVAIPVAVRNSSRPGVLLLAILFAVAFRVMLLFSEPIQEIDIYRYVWDGQTTLDGVSPYRYSPSQVVAARAGDQISQDLERLIALRDASPAVRTILSRIHYAELPTIYPPVSQAVFALATRSTPQSSDVWTRLFVMKVWMVAFDLGTLFVLIAILRHVRRPLGWSLAYGWCPLVIKEFANSGHLDSIAVFLAMSALYLTVQAAFPQRGTRAGEFSRGAASFVKLCPASALLALAIGAKLYSVVLAPLFLWTAWRRLGLVRSLSVFALFVSISAGVCSPMLAVGKHYPDRTFEVQFDAPPQPEAAPTFEQAQPPGRSLHAFLSRWEMNDFLFMLVVENIKPTGDGPSEPPWFAVAPSAWRSTLVSRLAAVLPVSGDRIPFFVARLITALCFAVLALIWAWKGSSSRAPELWLQNTFLTLAWFWLLLPTQNPWYWTWVLPLVPFARSRAWLAVSGLVLTYYVRFWLGYHWPNGPVAGTAYSGTLFFDYVVTWIEFGPWFVWLFIDHVRRRQGRASHAK